MLADSGWVRNGHRFLAIIGLFVLPIVYPLAIACSKFAILILFMRILPFGSTRYIIWLVGVTVALHAIVAALVAIFQCKPISALWTSIYREKCISTDEYLAYAAIPNVVTDLVMLVLPFPTIWNLRLEKRVKIGITITILTDSMYFLMYVVAPRSPFPYLRVKL
jgi:hypothetical protein